MDFFASSLTRVNDSSICIVDPGLQGSCTGKGTYYSQMERTTKVSGRMVLSMARAPSSTRWEADTRAIFKIGRSMAKE